MQSYVAWVKMTFYISREAVGLCHGCIDVSGRQLFAVISLAVPSGVNTGSRVDRHMVSFNLVLVGELSFIFSSAFIRCRYKRLIAMCCVRR